MSCTDVSGARLRHIYRELPNGTRSYSHIHDTQLDASCYFRLAADGQLRCLPSQFARTRREMFIDSACTARVLEVEKGHVRPSSTTRQFAAWQSYTQCDAPTEMFVVGDPLANAEIAVFEMRDGVCSETFTSPSFDYYTVQAELPPDAFVSGTKAWIDGGRVDVARIDGADGSLQCDHELRDQARGDALCELRVADDDEWRCVPKRFGHTQGRFRDPSCSQIDTVASMGGCSEGSGVAVDYVTCERMRFYDVGTRISNVYYRPFETCQVDSTEVGYYELGDALPATTFPLVQREYVATDDRLERVEYVVEGLRLHGSLWRDPDLDIVCSFAPAADGEPRCLPWVRSYMPVDSYFTDPTCSTPIELGRRVGDCDDPLPKYLVRSSNRRVYEVGDVFTGSVYRVHSGQCEPALSGFDYLTLIQEVPATTFASAVERQD